MGMVMSDKFPMHDFTTRLPGKSWITTFPKTFISERLAREAFKVLEKHGGRENFERIKASGGYRRPMLVCLLLEAWGYGDHMELLAMLSQRKEDEASRSL